MSNPQAQPAMDRRKFVSGLAGVTIVASAAAAMWAYHRRPQGTGLGAKNPFAYDVKDLLRTDPKLVRYEQVGRFRSPREEPRRLTFGPEGRLYLAAGSYVSVLDRQGAPISEIAMTAPARMVAVAKDGTMYVSLRNHIEVFDAKGQRQAGWDPPGKRPWITGLAVAENNVFAADAGNRLVWRYDRSGKVVGRIGEKNTDRHVPGFVLPSPYLDVEVHRDGLLRVNNPGRHQVEAYTFNGDLELSWGKPSSAIDGFCGCCNPINLALLPDGRIVTCEKGLPRVKVYANDGTFESVVAGPEAFPENAKVSLGDSPSDQVLCGLDAAAAPDGRIYILDQVTAEILIMAPKVTATHDSGKTPDRSA